MRDMSIAMLLVVLLAVALAALFGHLALWLNP
jgi:hypothetical protein